MKDKVRDRFKADLAHQNWLDKTYTKLILSKASVSRAPIYTAVVLLICWIALSLHTLEWVWFFELLNKFIVGHFFNPTGG